MTTPEEMQSFGRALEAAKEYADLILKSSLSELGGILSDTVGYWRLKNQVRLLLKAKNWLEEKGINSIELLPDIFVPLLNDGGNTENETLADMFASLLACHLDPNQQDLVHPSYTKVLSQLSPLDAVIMIQFRKFISYKESRDVGYREGGLIVSDIAKLVETTIREAYLSCFNLNRLGIIEHIGFHPPNDHPMSEMFKDNAEHQQFCITEYSVDFCNACYQYKDN